MNFQTSFENVTVHEAKQLAKRRLTLPTRMRVLRRVIEATRAGVPHLSPKVWSGSRLLEHCDALDGLMEKIDCIKLGSKDLMGLEVNCWLALAQMAAVLAGTDDVYVLAWVSRSCAIIAECADVTCPMAAETLAQIAASLREHLGVKDCACDGCVCAAAIKDVESRLDADGHTVEELIGLTNELRARVRELVGINAVDA